jgi:hypothetical protein
MKCHYWLNYLYCKLVEADIEFASSELFSFKFQRESERTR